MFFTIIKFTSVKILTVKTNIILVEYLNIYIKLAGWEKDLNRSPNTVGL